MLYEPTPQLARMFGSPTACDGCGENVMETHCHCLKGRTLRIPCFDAAPSP